MTILSERSILSSLIEKEEREREREGETLIERGILSSLIEREERERERGRLFSLREREGESDNPH